MSSINNYFLFFLMSVSSCHSVRSPEAIVHEIQKELNLPLSTDNPELHLQKLETYLQAAVAIDDRDFEGRSFPHLCMAICHYQFYFFIKPSKIRYDRLQIYYDTFDRWLNIAKSRSSGGSIPEHFWYIRKLLKHVDGRSRNAWKWSQQLVLQWQKHPDKYMELLGNMQYSYEVGGVFFYHGQATIEYKLIEDMRRTQCQKYLREFRENCLENLSLLEKMFEERLLLEKINLASQAYTDSVLQMARFHFAKLRRLSNRSLNKKEYLELENSKNALLLLGLENILLKNTCFIDKTPYLYYPSTIFFFHSHPYDVKYPYPKSPSGHDREMTFRIGPSIVFDVGRNYTVVYLVVLGEVTQIYKK